MNRKVHFTRYIWFGFLIIFTSLLFLFLIYESEFELQINQTNLYTKELCVISKTEINTIKYHCSIYEYINIVEMPCVRFFANTRSYKNVIFYRNFAEKLYSELYNCSYIPSACQTNSDYLNHHLKENFLQLVPKKNTYFECFILSNPKKLNETAVVMHLPDQMAFEAGLSLCYVALLTGFSMVIYGFKIKISYNNLRKRQLAYERYQKYFKKALDMAHINFEFINENSILVDDQSLKNHSDFRKSIRRASHKLHPEKVIIGKDEIHIGRIQTNSSQGLSRNGSKKSYYSICLYDKSKNNENPIGFENSTFISETD